MLRHLRFAVFLLCVPCSLAERRRLIKDIEVWFNAGKAYVVILLFLFPFLRANCLFFFCLFSFLQVRQSVLPVHRPAQLRAGGECLREGGGDAAPHLRAGHHRHQGCLRGPPQMALGQPRQQCHLPRLQQVSTLPRAQQVLASFSGVLRASRGRPSRLEGVRHVLRASRVPERSSGREDLFT